MEVNPRVKKFGRNTLYFFEMVFLLVVVLVFSDMFFGTSIFRGKVPHKDETLTACEQKLATCQKDLKTTVAAKKAVDTKLAKCEKNCAPPKVVTPASPKKDPPAVVVMARPPSEENNEIQMVYDCHDWSECGQRGKQFRANLNLGAGVYGVWHHGLVGDNITQNQFQQQQQQQGGHPKKKPQPQPGPQPDPCPGCGGDPGPPPTAGGPPANPNPPPIGGGPGNPNPPPTGGAPTNPNPGPVNLGS